MSEAHMDYQSMCAQIGKLYIESSCEIHRLTNMLLELQQKYTAECAKTAQLKAALEDMERKLSNESPKKGIDS